MREDNEFIATSEDLRLLPVNQISAIQNTCRRHLLLLLLAGWQDG